MGKFFFPAVVLFYGLSISHQATRWDNYLHIFDPRIHWFSLINSLVIVVFLCAMVSMIVYRSVSRDVRPFIHAFLFVQSSTASQISRYNAIDLSVRNPFGQHCYRSC
jgi:hypothetical protein